MTQIELKDLDTHLIDKNYIIGCDECGYGALAGKLVVCGVKAPKDWSFEGLNDSKKLTENRRKVMSDKLMKLISNGEITYHLAERTNEEIDKVGVYVALKDAYVEVFKKLYDDSSIIVIDGNLKFDNLGIDHMSPLSMIKADGKVCEVMAASIIGKHYRDTEMKALHNQYPYYDWISNVGYPAKLHKEGLAKHGATPLHRMSYAPLKALKK